MPSLSRPLRVLHVISGDLWAGAEVQAFTLLSTLQKNGVIVTAALMNDGELARRLRAHGIAVSIFDETRLNGFQILLALRKLMRNWKPDIVHTHRSKENVLASIANLLSGKAPSVRTAHGANEHSRRGLRQLHKRLFARLDLWCGRYLQQRIIAVSRDLAASLAKEFPRNKIVVIENGVDPANLQAQVHDVEFRSNDPLAKHVGIVGRLVPVKRFDLFLQTAASLRQRYPENNWRFHVFGDGPLREQLINQAQQLGITGLTTFHGHRGDIVACIASLDALVICSDHEGLPMTALEALAIGTPIVAHAVGGLPDALEENPRTALVRIHSATSYADAISDLLISKGNSSKPLPLADRFSASRNATNICALYLQLDT